MRVAMVSWEYPPLVVGGLAAHVDGLATAMARAGHEVVVLTRAPSLRARRLRGRGRARAARTRRPSLAAERQPPRPGDLGQPPARAARRPPAAVASRRRARPRLAGRLGGRHVARGLCARRSSRRSTPPSAAATRGTCTSTTSEAINASEWWLTYQAPARHLLLGVHGATRSCARSSCPATRSRWCRTASTPSRFRATGVTRAGADAPLIVSWGRLQYEKGFQTLIAAVARLVRSPVPRCGACSSGGAPTRTSCEASPAGSVSSTSVQFAGFVQRRGARAAC